MSSEHSFQVEFIPPFILLGSQEARDYLEEKDDDPSVKYVQLYLFWDLSHVLKEMWGEHIEESKTVHYICYPFTGPQFDAIFGKPNVRWTAALESEFLHQCEELSFEDPPKGYGFTYEKRRRVYLRSGLPDNTPIKRATHE